MFTELAEEYQPGNFVFPQVRRVTLEEWMDLTENWTISPEDHVAFVYMGGAFVVAFADTKHVEFADLLTGQLCLPPEMYLVPVFKSIAKKDGPFVVSFQFGYKTSSYPTRYSPVRTEEYPTRVLTVDKLLFPHYGDYSWRQLYNRKTAAYFNVHKSVTKVQASYLGTSWYGLRRTEAPGVMLRGPEGYIIYLREEAENVENE